MPELATGTAAPFWPMPSIAKRVATFGGKAFGAARKKGRRHHAGVDILAPRGAEVVAPESGVIVATQRFNGPNAHALLLQTDSGPVILLGEVEPGSWNQYGAGIGSRVEGGQPVAQVGINPGGSTMLHFEMYKEGTGRNHQWWKGGAPPPQLLDPTAYLETAAAGEPIQPVPSDDTDHEHPEEPATTPHEPGNDDVMPDDTFDPTATPEQAWVNQTMTPADFDTFWGNDYKPAGKYSNQQLACTQRGGTYAPRASWGGGLNDDAGDCHMPDGGTCPSWELLTGRCPGDDDAVVPVEPPVVEDPAIEDVATEGDDVDPWVVLPDIGLPKWQLPFGVPWWVGLLAAGVLLLGWSDKD